MTSRRQNRLSINCKLYVNPELIGYNIKIPSQYLSDIINITSNNNTELPVFNIAKSGLLVSVIEYIDERATVYVSSEIFHKIKQYRDKNGFILMELFTDYSQGSSVLLEPIHTKFLDIKDQTALLQDYISSNIRLLYPRQEFQVYSTELELILNFRVIKTNNTRFQVITAYNTDLTVDFDCKNIMSRLILPADFRDFNNMYLTDHTISNIKCACDYVKKGLYNGDIDISIICQQCSNR